MSIDEFYYSCDACSKISSGRCWKHASETVVLGQNIKYFDCGNKHPYKCPVCEGTGLVSKPPHIAGDVHEWTDSGTAPYACKACGGQGVIWG